MRRAEKTFLVLCALGLAILFAAPAQAGFPAVEGRTGGASAGAGTSHTVNIPSGCASGEMLVIMLTSDNVSHTFPAGYTSFASASYNAANSRNNYVFRRCDGTEGSSITVTTVAITRSAHVSYMISGVSNDSDPEATGDSGSSSTPDPPSETASWGAKDNLWLAVAAYNDGTFTVSAYPSSYTDGINHRENDAAGYGAGSAERKLNAASEDPGTFTLSSSATWGAGTVVLRPRESPETFTITGSWVAPASVTEATAECWGGGGAGGNRNNSGSGGAGGGGGGAYSKGTVGVTAGNSYTVTVGTGGDQTGGNNNNSGPGGNDSSFVGDAAATVLAKGGTGGTGGIAGAGGAGGAAGSGEGSVKFSGGDGATGNSTGGGGGGGAGDAAVGGNASGGTAGTGGTAGGGNGGTGAANTAGTDGSTLGGGGAGGHRSSGGAKAGADGARGQCVVSWTEGGAPPASTVKRRILTSIELREYEIVL